jgi:hypothetical protein
MFYLRENLFVARLLRRTLILPKVLRTQNPQSCTDVAVCDAHFPKTEDGNYDIPLVLLWDVAVLRGRWWRNFRPPPPNQRPPPAAAAAALS